MTVATTLPFSSDAEAQQVAANLNGTALLVVDRHEEIITELPPLPYTTATLLEEAALAFNWPVSQVTLIAQTLFEHGLITYPRTGSVHVADEAIKTGKQVVLALFGKDALGLVGESFPPPDEEISEAEAHEAIRPTHPDRHPDELRAFDLDSCRLYRLIWARFLASLMKPARYRVITVNLEPAP